MESRKKKGATRSYYNSESGGASSCDEDNVNNDKKRGSNKKNLDEKNTYNIGTDEDNKSKSSAEIQQQQDDSNQKARNRKSTILTMSFIHSIQRLFSPWKGAGAFFKAQVQVTVVLVLAYIGNNWPHAYPRNDNHNMTMFWTMNAFILVVAGFTLKHDPKISKRGVQLLSRQQTEEWKGWMQWAFIMYHYYRAYSVYNEIRVFVSAYVWMTGFGNFLYFDKSQDFSVQRAVSMWLRINYFPLMLSTFLGVALELYYVVPLHTVSFFITMATCFISKKMEAYNSTLTRDQRNAVAIFICLVVHVVFYETRAVHFLELFSKEYSFRFQSDKYTAWVGILSGFFWHRFQHYMQWAFLVPPSSSTTTNNTTTIEQQQPAATTTTAVANATSGEEAVDEDLEKRQTHSSVMLQKWAPWIQRISGISIFAVWYYCFGSITDKYIYNPWHPYIFWMPVSAWLMLRNSSKYLTELHSTALEFFGRITLETYVLQFHLFMCRDVQFIPIVIPGSGPDGTLFVKTLNMLLCGAIFVAVAFYARQITITTQETVTELVGLIMNHRFFGGTGTLGTPSDSSERAKMLKTMSSDLEQADVGVAGEGGGAAANKLETKSNGIESAPLSSSSLS